MLADIGRNMDEFFGKIFNNLINLEPFNWLAEIKNFNNSEKCLFSLVIINILFTCYIQLKWYCLHFYSSYAAGELLINYHGGFVRRGLLGEIFSIFAGTWFFQPFMFIILYLAAFLVSFYFLKWLLSVFEPILAILIFGSPGIFAIHFFTWNITRRDFIIMGGIILLHYLILSAYKNKYNIFKTLSIFLLIYTPCFLIHESMLFFMGGPALFLLLCYKKISQKACIIVFFFILAVISAYLGLYSGSPEKSQAMVDWWKSIYPNLKDLRAMGEFNGWSLQKYPPLYDYLTFKSAPSIIFGYILSIIPVAICLYKVKPLNLIKNLTDKHILYLCGFILSYIGCVVIYARCMTDMGREVPMENFYVIIMIITLIKMNLGKENIYKNFSKINLLYPYIFIPLILYLFVWQLKIWIPPDGKTFLDSQLWQRYFLFN